MFKPTDYKAIAAWGKRLGSFGYYIQSEQEKAVAMKAPVDALYERDGVWTCVSDLSVDHSFRIQFTGIEPTQKQLAELRLTRAQEEFKRVSLELTAASFDLNKFTG